MYKAIGYDKFFDATYYDMSEDKTKNYGLKDKPFFEESMPLLKSLKQPFYTRGMPLMYSLETSKWPEPTAACFALY